MRSKYIATVKIQCHWRDEQNALQYYSESDFAVQMPPGTNLPLIHSKELNKYTSKPIDLEREIMDLQSLVPASGMFISYNLPLPRIQSTTKVVLSTGIAINVKQLTNELKINK